MQTIIQQTKHGDIHIDNSGRNVVLVSMKGMIPDEAQVIWVRRENLPAIVKALSECLPNDNSAQMPNVHVSKQVGFATGLHSTVIWQVGEKGDPEEALCIGGWIDKRIGIRQGEDEIICNHSTIDELCEALKQVKKYNDEENYD